MIRVALIGAGPMGKRHLEAARSIDCAVAAVADVDATRLEETAAQFRLSRDVLFTDARAMLRARTADCVIIATTAPSHCELTEIAAEAGVRFILCEKPMATSVDECDRMIAACERSGSSLAINHQIRFVPAYVEAKRQLESARFGGVTSVNVIAGNFGLAMVGTHMFEMLRFLTDELPVSVNAWFSPERFTNPRGACFEDRAGSVRVLTSGGKRLYIDAGADQGHGVKVLFGARFGQLLLDPLESTVVTWCRRAEDRELPATRYGTETVKDAHPIEKSGPLEASAAVLRAMFAGGEYPTGRDGRLALATLIACHLSAERNGAATTLEAVEGVRERRFPWA